MQHASINANPVWAKWLSSKRQQIWSVRNHYLVVLLHLLQQVESVGESDGEIPGYSTENPTGEREREREREAVMLGNKTEWI